MVEGGWWLIWGLTRGSVVRRKEEKMKVRVGLGEDTQPLTSVTSNEEWCMSSGIRSRSGRGYLTTLLVRTLPTVSLFPGTLSQSSHTTI